VLTNTPHALTVDKAPKKRRARPQRTPATAHFATLKKRLESSINLPGELPTDFGFERTAFGMRITPGAPWNIGWLEFAVPCEHFAVTRMELTNLLPLPQQTTPNAAVADVMMISLILEGSGSVSIDGRVSHWQAPSCLIVTAGSKAVPPPHTIGPAQRQRMVIIALPRRFLTEIWKLHSATLPDVLRGLEEGAAGLNLEILPMTPELIGIAGAIMQCNYSGALLDKYLESKVYEALCLIIAGAARRASHLEKSLVLTRRDVDQLNAAQAIVARRFAKPPSIVALSREVGLNRNKLCAGFVAHFGITIHEYVRELRLSKALEMFRSDSGSVMEVAVAVGYEHASNLSAALKKRYGLSPKQLRTRKRVAVTQRA
jgi:AraC family transcriptional regulator, transcriptional activator of the genes for pyochelin and ferripyochelin receptors